MKPSMVALPPNNPIYHPTPTQPFIGGLKKNTEKEKEKEKTSKYQIDHVNKFKAWSNNWNKPIEKERGR